MPVASIDPDQRVGALVQPGRQMGQLPRVATAHSVELGDDDDPGREQRDTDAGDEARGGNHRDPSGIESGQVWRHGESSNVDVCRNSLPRTLTVGPRMIERGLDRVEAVRLGALGRA